MRLEGWLETPAIVALPDQHRSPTARRKAQELLRRDGAVKVFFIEFQRTARTSSQRIADQFGTTLNAAISEMLEQGLDEAHAWEALGSYFQGLNAQDAQPDLRSLTATAIGHGIQVLAADMDYDQARAVLKEQNLSEVNLFLSTGLTIRDTSAASLIAKYLHSATSLETGRLMLWGVNHFTENVAFSTYCDTRLQILLAQHGLAVHVATDDEMAP
ncbi:hypothetical protein AACH06_07105 [Ideonella sp. DXS29W]|uniref:Uncharacterized protein n=1 Tax=Ideonella lacteola TaxID=2984193 RepID=A0ABU9BL82_9BURK